MNEPYHENGNCKPKRKRIPCKPIPELTEKQLRNFWRKVDKNGPLPDQNIIYYKGLGQCWVWTACKYKGYGLFGIGNRAFQSHRVSKYLSQPFDPDSLALHRCDNCMCVNPDHIFLGNDMTNHHDKENKGRRNDIKGSKHQRSKLIENEIPEIRNLHLSGMSQVDIGKKFNVTKHTIGAILNNRNWKHIS